MLLNLSVFQEEPKIGFLRVWNLPILKYWHIMQNWKIKSQFGTGQTKYNCGLNGTDFRPEGCFLEVNVGFRYFRWPD